MRANFPSRSALTRGTRKGPSLEVLFFKMGGFSGAVRRIIAPWKRPFTANQVKVALVRRHPEMIPGEFQIEDILEWMVVQKRLQRVDERSYQHSARKMIPVKIHISPRKLQLHFTL